MDSDTMRKWLLLALTAGSLPAAVIRGTVIENQTGRPLARSTVMLEPVAGAGSTTVRTNLYGSFEFAGLGAGAYFVTASRRGFASVQYGQKRWKAAGTPIVLEPAGSVVLNIRLPRFGAIAGTVLDENDVGLPEHDVVAYRATRPLQLAARARADERGQYRISGLEPGRYFVRTAAKLYDDSSYVPTFHRETQRLEEALTVDVALDQDTQNVNVRPVPGRLVTIGGQITPPAQINITLVSDTGTETTVSDNSGRFQFNPAAPGQYELYAQAPPEPRTGNIQAVYQPISIDRDRSDIRLALRPLPQVEFVFKDNKGQAVDSRSVRVLARRKDLSGAGKTQTLQLPGDRLAFLPGRWDLALAPLPGYYVAGFSSSRSQPNETGRADGWNEVVLNGNLEMAQFLLSATPGGVHGQVTGPGHDPVAGAPVYLEMYDPAARRRVKDVQSTRADARGQFHFADLAPGNYRALSSFDFEAPDALMEVRGARTFRVEESREALQDLDLIEIR